MCNWFKSNLNAKCQAFNHPSFPNKIILFVFRDDNKINKRDAPAICDLHRCKDGPVRNGHVGQRPPSINPERLKGFVEEDYLNGDVKTWEMKIVSRNEELLGDALSLIPQSNTRTSQSSHNKLIRFEDISAAAFKIQSGVQKTPCMVGNSYGFEYSLIKIDQKWKKSMHYLQQIDLCKMTHIYISCCELSIIIFFLPVYINLNPQRLQWPVNKG